MVSAPQRSVWLDTDPGFDDWLAMLMLAADLQVHWVGTSVVAGNAPLDITMANALRIGHYYGLAVPMHRGCSKPLRVELESALGVLGEQGMRTRGEPLPDVQAQPASSDGVTAMVQALKSSPQPMTLIALGPLTNVATALTQDPTIVGCIGELLLMGGSTERGNHTPAAEFNIHADPEAADIVFNAGVPLRMFGLNVCAQALVDQSHVREVQSWPGQRAAWLAGYLDAYQRIRSSDGQVPMPLFDPVVTAWLAAPELFECRPARVDIELHGRFTRGMTVCDFKTKPGRAFNAQVAMQADGARVVRLVLDRVRASLTFKPDGPLVTRPQPPRSRR